jgi:hypothetical protein
MVLEILGISFGVSFGLGLYFVGKYHEQQERREWYRLKAQTLAMLKDSKDEKEIEMYNKLLKTEFK